MRPCGEGVGSLYLRGAQGPLPYPDGCPPTGAEAPSHTRWRCCPYSASAHLPAGNFLRTPTLSATGPGPAPEEPGRRGLGVTHSPRSPRHSQRRFNSCQDARARGTIRPRPPWRSTGHWQPDPVPALPRSHAGYRGWGFALGGAGTCLIQRHRGWRERTGGSSSPRG